MKATDRCVQRSQKQEAKLPKDRIRMPFAHMLINLCNVLRPRKRKQHKAINRRGYQRLEDIRQFRTVLAENKKTDKRKGSK